MKIIGIIPARYNSSRFEGKPLADICGKPMVWWVYNQVKKVKEISEVYVATDDERIASVCKELSIDYVMTRNDHSTSTERLLEVAQKIKSDLYVCINGDEPLIEPEIIRAIIPNQLPETTFYVSNLMTEIRNPVEVVDFTNIKVVVDYENYALFMSRSPIPYPKTSMDYKFYKHVGVLIYDICALRFFADTLKGYNEKIEDINELRYIENGKKLKMIKVDANTLSVDTPKDLEKVRNIVTGQLEMERIKHD